jgi:hypothetical protein
VITLDSYVYCRYSIVHETSDSECPYDHTHFAFEFKKKVSRRGGAFIIEGINPHIQLFNSASHKQRTFEDYHTKAPVRIEQSNDGPTAHQTLIEEVREARSLADACELVGVSIKSVSDVKLIRDDVTRPDDYIHKYPDTAWRDIGVRPDWRVLFIHGKTNTGKTQWALHQLRRPLLVGHMDTLKTFDPTRHDGT